MTLAAIKDVRRRGVRGIAVSSHDLRGGEFTPGIYQLGGR
jgi:hypothetical protein